MIRKGRRILPLTTLRLGAGLLLIPAACSSARADGDGISILAFEGSLSAWADGGDPNTGNGPLPESNFFGLRSPIVSQTIYAYSGAATGIAGASVNVNNDSGGSFACGGQLMTQGWPDFPDGSNASASVIYELFFSVPDTRTFSFTSTKNIDSDSGPMQLINTGGYYGGWVGSTIYPGQYELFWDGVTDVVQGGKGPGYQQTTFDLLIDPAPVGPAPVTVTAGQRYNFPVFLTNGSHTEQINGLTVQATGVATISNSSGPATHQLLVISQAGLSISGSAGAWLGLLDVANNDLDLPTGSLANATDQLSEGYANGSWAGAGGIVSTTAAADSTHLTALGIMQNNQDGTQIYSAGNLFDGTAPGAADVLVKYTYYGDANLDGKVDGSDYSLIDNGYLSGLTGWFNGDFNYDGMIDGSDYTLIDNAFNSQGASLSAQVTGVNAEIAPASAATVPEPAALSIFTISSLGLLRRRAHHTGSASC